jgi:hypothetical protein
MRHTLGIVLCAGCALAQSGIEVPAIGTIVDSSGSLRSVQGVAGSFWLAPTLKPAGVPRALSAACSERLCLVKTDAKVVSPTGETDAPPGPAIFGVTAGDAIVFFPMTHTFARWHDDALDPLDWAVDGEVLSVLRRDGEIEIAVRHDGQVGIVHPDGSMVDSIAESTGPVTLVPDGVLFATADEIVVRHLDGTQARFYLAGAGSIDAMGPHYAAIRMGGRGGAIYVLRTENGRESLFLLPGTTP